MVSTTVFKKLYLRDKKQAFEDILDAYKKKGFLVVNYLYFANLISNGILGGKKVNKDFLNAILDGDFLLPDGVALSLYCKRHFNIFLPNLNGTDFSEYFLKNLEPNAYNLILYGAKGDVIKEAVRNIKKRYNAEVIYFQDGYREFDFSRLDAAISNSLAHSSCNSEKINVFMVGLGTPKQEIWVKKNLENIKKYKLLTFTQGGTFDFWAGKEKRAPSIFLKLKLEWLWRLITNPKKNFKKVWYSLYLFYYLLRK